MTMVFTFNERPADSPFVELIWRTTSDNIKPESFLSTAVTSHEIIITIQRDTTSVTIKGPETHASLADIPMEAEFIGITLKPGAMLTPFPATSLVDGGINLPTASDNKFWLHGTAWQLFDYENADTFVDRLVRSGLLIRDPIVQSALLGQQPDASPRTIQRHFRHVTGLTQGTIEQIERAHHAVTLLEEGTSILDTVHQAGYADQPHLTRSLKRFIGRTPAQIITP